MDAILFDPVISIRRALILDGPTIGVTWFVAVAYCNWLSQHEVLPEDQWCYQRNGRDEYGHGMVVPADVLKRSGYVFRPSPNGSTRAEPAQAPSATTAALPTCWKLTHASTRTAVCTLGWAAA
jgi:hypothetical protein